MTVLRTQLRGVGRRPTKLLLTGLGILVAAFFAYATVLAQQIAEQTVADGLSETPAGASVVVTSGATLLPPATLAAVQKAPGVAEAAGRVNGGAQLGTGDSARYLLIASDPGSGSLSRVKVASGSYPDAPGEVAITARTAERDGLRVGQRITLSTDRPTGPDGGVGPSRRDTVLVTGVVTAPEDQGQQLYTQDRSAAALLDTGFSRIDVRAAAGANAGDLSQALSGLLPPPAGTQPPTGTEPPTGGTLDPAAGVAARVRPAVDVRAEEIDKKVEQIKPLFALLSMFVVIAVIAAALVVTSTFRIMFAQRMSQLALLRAVGAARGRLTGALIVEGAITGLVAGVTGVLVALGTGHTVPRLAGAFGRDLPAPGAPLGWAIAIVLGSVLVTVVAVLAPAYSAARVSPLQALRTSATSNARTGIGVLRTLLGIALVAVAAGTAGLAMTAAGPLKEDTILTLATIVASGTAAFCALLALGPVLVRPLLRVIGWPVNRFGPVGRLAVGGVGGAPRRAAAVSAVVALGVTLIAGVLVGSATLRTLADSELALEYPADIEARVTEAGSALPRGLVERLQAREEMAEVLPYRRVTVAVGEQEVPLADLDVRALPSSKQFQVVGGSLTDLGPGRVAVPAVWAETLGVKAGDELVLKLGGRERVVRVGAVINSAGPLSGATIADPSDLARLDPSAPVTGVLINARGDGDQDVDEARAAVVAELGGAEGMSLDILADKRSETLGWLTATTAIALGLLGLTVLIAVVGVGTTTALSVVERTRESGMLRAVGLSKGGLRTSLATEAGLYGVVGSVLGLALGIPYAALMLDVLDIGAPLVLPTGQLIGVFAVLAALTALAGLLPANRAAKVSPVAALAHE